MLQHPLDLPVGPNDPMPRQRPQSQDSTDSFPPLTDDDLSSFERKVSSPFQHNNDAIIRAQSPFGRRYMKPINGIQTKGFARSAQRRSSVLTLGSIERLQNFYAKKELKVNKGGTLGFRHAALTEEPDDLEDDLPTPREPPPSWIDLDIETDLDVLQSLCFQDIQATLATWSMVTGPNRLSSSSSSSHPLAGESDEQGADFQILPLLQSVTKMLSSVKNYTVNRHDLSDSSLSKLRHASLNLLEAMKELENQHRVKEDVDDSDESDGFLYQSLDFNLLEKERMAIHTYLNVVEQHAFNPPHHIGSPPAMFTPEIQALMGKTQILSLTENELQDQQQMNLEQPTRIKQTTNRIPEWLERSSFVNDTMGRYHALILDNLDGSFEKEDVPNPQEDEDAFLQFLSDGIALCNVYNSLVKRSRRPFGLITKIHNDSRRTYRAIENLRFFSAACKFRFELVFPEFDPSEIARKTDKGLVMMKKTLSTFCDCVIRELREQVDSLKSAAAK